MGLSSGGRIEFADSGSAELQPLIEYPRLRRMGPLEGLDQKPETVTTAPEPKRHKHIVVRSHAPTAIIGPHPHQARWAMSAPPSTAYLHAALPITHWP